MMRIKRVKKLEQIIKTSKSRRRAKIVLSEHEEAQEDSSKQGRKTSDIHEDPNISLVQDEGMTYGEKGEKEVTTPINYQTYIKRRRGVSIGSGRVSTASRQVNTTDVSTAIEIGSTAGEKAKDKGKGIMTEPEPEKKTKLQQRQERASLDAAIRLEEQFNEEETQRIARDAEIAKQLQEEFNKAEQERVVAKNDEAHIDWSDPAVLSHFKGIKYKDIRPIYEKVWDRNHTFVPKDSDIEKEVIERQGFDLQQESSKKTGGSRKKTLARKRTGEKKSDQSAKR
ncbi:hypothetical protein Tco_1037336 [Tanacetum coccineum]|uniref:Uncharacterized protein n=1 Tax=Tanacetum coccineum TaxID=301880 RepID=A0ABQ5FF26_9ASTR